MPSKKRSKKNADPANSETKFEIWCRVAWENASSAERAALRRTAKLEHIYSPTTIFSVAAERAKTRLLVLPLFEELGPTGALLQMKLKGVFLSELTALTLIEALNYQLVQSVDRMFARARVRVMRECLENRSPWPEA